MKFMNMKRFGATVMAGALALSLTAPAFAAGSNTTTTITGTYNAIQMDVTIPTTGTATINPYGLPFNLTHEEAATPPATGNVDVVDAAISGEQITTAPQYIINGSKVALAVSADVVGEVTTGSDVVLIADAAAVDTANTDGDVLKNVAAKFEVFPAPGIEGDPADFEKADINVAFAALKSENAALTAPVLEATDEVASTATTGSLVLREGDDDGFPQDGSVAYIRLAGAVAKKPTTAWATTDKFTATIAFSFEPAEYVGAVTVTGAESVAVGATAKLTVSGLPQGVTAKYDTIKWTSSKTANVTVVDGTKKPTAPATTVDAVIGTVSGVKSGTTKSVITVEFEGSDGITYRGSAEVKCG